MSDKDKFDEEAEEWLPCECGTYLQQGLGIHRSSCGVWKRPAVATRLRELAFIASVEIAKREAMVILLTQARAKREDARALGDERIRALEAEIERLRADTGEIQSHVDDNNRLPDKLAQAQVEIVALRMQMGKAREIMEFHNCADKMGMYVTKPCRLCTWLAANREGK